MGGSCQSLLVAVGQVHNTHNCNHPLSTNYGLYCIDYILYRLHTSYVSATIHGKVQIHVTIGCPQNTVLRICLWKENCRFADSPTKKGKWWFFLKMPHFWLNMIYNCVRRCFGYHIDTWKWMCTVCLRALGGFNQRRFPRNLFAANLWMHSAHWVRWSTFKVYTVRVYTPIIWR